MKRKLKTNKSCLKRFRLTRNGKIMVFKNKLKKASKRSKNLAKTAMLLTSTLTKMAKRMLGK